ncbi:MAG: hypothetical protein Q9198_006174 [Flavoplaca austrocitrina]
MKPQSPSTDSHPIASHPVPTTEPSSLDLPNMKPQSSSTDSHPLTSHQAPTTEPSSHDLPNMKPQSSSTDSHPLTSHPTPTTESSSPSHVTATQAVQAQGPAFSDNPISAPSAPITELSPVSNGTQVNQELAPTPDVSATLILSENQVQSAVLPMTPRNGEFLKSLSLSFSPKPHLQSFRLMDLPVEIRDEIYAFAVVHQGYINPLVWLARSRPSPGLFADLPVIDHFASDNANCCYFGPKGQNTTHFHLCQLFFVSKAVSEAAQRIYYQRNKFFFFCTQDFLEIPRMFPDYTSYLRTIGISLGTKINDRGVAGLLKMGNFSQLRHLIIYMSFRPGFAKARGVQELLTLRGIPKVEIFEINRGEGVSQTEIDHFKCLLKLNIQKPLSLTR